MSFSEGKYLIFIVAAFLINSGVCQNSQHIFNASNVS